MITQGGRFAGWGLVILDGSSVWAYKNTQQPNDGIRIAGPNKLTPGGHVVSVDFAYDGKKGEFGKGGSYVLKVDGAESSPKPRSATRFRSSTRSMKRSTSARTAARRSSTITRTDAVQVQWHNR